MSKRSDHDGYVAKQADGSWRGSIQLGGRRIYRRGTTKGAVVTKLRALRDQHERGTLAASSPTVADWLQHWLDNIAVHRVRPRTLETYRDLVRVHIEPALGKHRLDKLRPEHIEAAWAQIDRAPSTVLRCHRVLARALVVASQRGHLLIPPTSRMDAPRAPRKEQTALTAAEAKAVLAAAVGDRLSARWTVALALGLRQGEALGLRWSDVDLVGAEIVVRVKLEHVRGVGPVLSEPKTHRSAGRRIRIPAQLLPALREHNVQQKRERLAVGAAWHRGEFDGLVFTTLLGTPIDRHNDRRAWLRLLKAAGVPAVRLHDARHTAATLLLEQKVPERVVMEILGHSSTRITQDIYQHVTRTLSTEAAEAMERVLWDEAAP